MIQVLTLTDEAVKLIDNLVHEADLPEGGGLRIAQRDDHLALAMSLAEHSQPADVVLHDGAATVFLGPIAPDRLTCQTLDAKTGQAGCAFYLRG